MVHSTDLESLRPKRTREFESRLLRLCFTYIFKIKILKIRKFENSRLQGEALRS